MPSKITPEPPSTERRARLFRNGRNQAIRIPRDFEFTADEVLIHKEGHRLIVEPFPAPSGLAETLASWEPLEDDFEVGDGDLLPLDDIDL